MFTPKDYIVVCHGCGKFHIVVAHFLGMPLSIGFKDGVTTWCIPAYACPECQSEPSVIGKDGRRCGRIKDAFVHGMSADARARANSEFPEWLPRLRENQKRSY